MPTKLGSLWRKHIWNDSVGPWLALAVWILPLCFWCYQDQHPRCPPLSKEIQTIIGTLPVIQIDNLTTSDSLHEPVYGLFDDEQHIIKLRKNVGEVVKRQALEHERFHAILWEAGYSELPIEVEERLADIIGTYRVWELQQQCKF